MSEQKRIAFLCHPYHRGGVTRWMADAAIALAAAGSEVYFVTVDPVKPFHSGKGRDKMLSLVTGAEKNLHIISCHVNYSFEFGTENYRAKIYSNLVLNNVPAGTPLILSDDAAVWAAAAHVAGKYPVVGVIHGNDDIYYTNARKYAQQLSVCVCVSNELKRNVLTRCPGIDVAKVTVIPCGIDLVVFERADATDGILQLIFIGRIQDKVKRATDLVHIAYQLQKKGVNFHLSIIGNSKESAAEFSESFHEAGLESFVTFRGWLTKPEIQQMLNSTDILLLTSDSEGMPIVMMEALASGCGFVGTRVGGIRDYEMHPLAANCLAVYAVGDINDAVNKINKVAAISRNLRMPAARKLAESEFSMQVCLQKYFKAIDNIPVEAAVPNPIVLSPFQIFYSKAIAAARRLKVRVKS